MKKTKLFLLSLLTATITLVGMPLSAVNNTIYAANRDLTSNPTHAQNPRISRDAQDEIESVDYDTINIGTYDNNPIVWRVLNVTDGKALLLSDISLCEKTFNPSQSTDWDSSTLKQWLNGETAGDFYNDSFSDNEKSAIIGDIIIPTLDDMKNESYGFPNNNYASQMRAVEGAGAGYWTRSTGVLSQGICLAWVQNNGKIEDFTGVYNAGLDNGVRPMINVDLKKLASSDTEYLMTGDESGLSWQKDSGKDLTFTIKTGIDVDDSYEHFDSLVLDGKTLTRDKDYTATKGSTIITIKVATLEALSEGEHTINVVFDNGNFESKLTILSAQENITPNTDSEVTPATGDGESIALTTCVLIAASAALSITAFARKVYKSR